MPNNFHDLFSGTKFNSHPHACIIYDDLIYYRRVASSFIVDGLNKNEKCIMAVDEYHPDFIKADFERAGVDIDSFIKDGKLTLIDVKSSYSGNGGFDPDSTIKIWQEECDKAISEGYNALSVVGEATFSLGNPELVDKLIYYENVMNDVLFKKFPFKSLCVYNRKLYPLEIIKTAICAHPILFYNDKLFGENIYYIPPEIYFKDENARDEIDIMLRNIQRNNDNIVALQDSETKFRMMFDKAPLSYQSLDEKGNFVEINENWLNVLGYKKEEVVGRNFSEFLHPEWKDHFKENFPRFKAVGEVLGVEFEMIKKDGSYILVSFHGKIGKNSDDSFSRTHCIFQDITERKRIEKELEISERRFRDLTLSMADWVWEVDQNGVYTYASDSVTKVLGYTADELIGKTPFDLMVEDIIDDTKNEFFKFLKDKKAIVNLKNFNLTKNGERVISLTNGIPFTDEAGAFMGYRGVDRDITTEYELSLKIQQSQKMEAIGNLAGGIAHDFNNVLFPIIGMSELMMEDLPPGSLEMEHANEIYKAGHRAKELVSQILVFSRQSDQKKIPVRFQNVLKEVLKLCRSTIPVNIEIVQKIQQDCGSIRGNATQLHQIGMNLITNAYHAVQEKNGKIIVGLEEIEIDQINLIDTSINPGKYLLFTVSDDGIGMAEKLKNKIFEPYFTTKEQGKGTGLGLAVVYGIVKEYGGEIEMETEIGSGTTFRIYLPLIDKSEDKSITEAKTELETGHENILLVDDEPAVVRLEQQMLERLGYKISSHTSSLDAVEVFRSNPDAFDIVLTDMTMPNMTGDQLAKEILSIKPDMPIIICTGFSENMNKEQAEIIGIKGFLMKPVIKSDMAQMVRKVLDAINNNEPHGGDIFKS